MHKLLFIHVYSVLLCWCKLLLIHGYSVSLCWWKNCCLVFLGYAQIVKACRVFVLSTIVYTPCPKPHSWFTLQWWSCHMNISCKWPIAVWYFLRYPQFMHQLQFVLLVVHISPMYHSHFCTVFGYMFPLWFLLYTLLLFNSCTSCSLVLVIYISRLLMDLPWYNHNGWHQVTYLLSYQVKHQVTYCSCAICILILLFCSWDVAVHVLFFVFNLKRNYFVLNVFYT